MKSIPALIRRRLWPDSPPKNPVVRALLTVARYLFALIRDLAAGEINLRAMSLVYTTVLAIVPTLAVAFALAKGFGIHRQMEPLLRRFLQPIGPRANEFTDTIISTVDNISGVTLTLLSIVLLFPTVISMAQKVEGSFNFIWRVDRPRSFGRRMTDYLSVILIGPTIMLVATGLIGSLSNEAILDRMRAGDTLAAWLTGFGEVFPYLMVIFAFCFLYLFIPNTRVHWRPALIGGLVAGSIWTASGYLFADLVATSARLEAIYSGFVVVFSAMLWLYLTWIIFLLGSQLAFYIQNPYHLRHGQRTVPISNGIRERLSLSIMFKVASEFADPSHGWTDESLAATLRVPRPVIEPIIAGLIEDQLLSKDDDQRLIPGRDPHRIALTEIVDSMRGGSAFELQSRGSWSSAVNAIADRIETAIKAELGSNTLGDLVDANLPPPDEAPRTELVG